MDTQSNPENISPFASILNSGTKNETHPNCRVIQAELSDGTSAWLVSGFKEVRETLIDQRYSRAEALAADRPKRGMELIISETGLGTDPPEHTSLRRLLSGAFTENKIQDFQPRVVQIINDLIDQIIVTPHPAELIHEFTHPLSTRVICEFLGISLADIRDLSAWSNKIYADWDRPRIDMEISYDAIKGWVAQLLRNEKTLPRTGFIAFLVHASKKHGKPSESEVVSLISGLLIAGRETTSNQMTLALSALLQHPAQVNLLQNDTGLIPGAVEELLRYVEVGSAPPARVTKEAVKLGGVAIPAGAVVLPLLDAANRDPLAFPNPSKLDVTRQAGSHATFGAGVHYCLGSQLVRMQIRESVYWLLKRLPGLRATATIKSVQSGGDATIAEMKLPITWEEM
jgi:cytochrome P450